MEDELLQEIAWFQEYKNGDYTISILYKNYLEWNNNFYISMKYDDNYYIKKYNNFSKNDFTIYRENPLKLTFSERLQWLKEGKKYETYIPLIFEENKSIYNIIRYNFIQIENIFNNRSKLITEKDLYYMYNENLEKSYYCFYISKNNVEIIKLRND